MEARCKAAQHSTGWMAGAFAKCVRSKELVLTHFSARYDRPGGGSSAQKPSKGDWRPRPVDPEAETEAAMRSVEALVQEARDYYGGKVRAAHDFYSLDVPLRC